MKAPDSKLDGDHIWQARIGCMVVPLLLVLIFLYLYFGGESHKERGRSGFTSSEMRTIAKILDQYKTENDFYPPRPNGDQYYGPFKELFCNLQKIPFDPCIQAEHPIDPNRTKQLFPNEKKSIAYYDAPRNPDWRVKYEGYPLRYFRSLDGKWALLIGNGPDEEPDISEFDLSLISPDEPAYVSVARTLDETFRSSIYDPTNGTVSTGDVWWVIAPFERDEGTSPKL